jgi:hypothetical protein
VSVSNDFSAYSNSLKKPVKSSFLNAMSGMPDQEAIGYVVSANGVKIINTMRFLNEPTAFANTFFHS